MFLCVVPNDLTIIIVSAIIHHIYSLRHIYSVRACVHVCVCVCMCAKESIRICSNCEVQQS